MSPDDVNRIAFLKGVDPIGKPKWEIIRLIQIKEGNQPCYATQHFECQHLECFWRQDCIGKVRLIEVQ